MQRILFVCARNRLRSPTAEAIFAGIAGIEVSSAGTAPDAECLLSADLLEWADVVFVMERSQQRFIGQRFSSVMKGKRLVSLEIVDQYTYMQPELIEILQMKVSPWLRNGLAQQEQKMWYDSSKTR